MLEILRAFGTAPPLDAVLGQLGRVNVICGKNNSGKTTLLTAIDSPDRRGLGGNISKTAATEIAMGAVDSSPFKRGTGNDFERSIYHDWLVNLLLSREVWFTTDTDALTSQISNGVANNSYLKRYRLDVADVGRRLAAHLGQFPDTVLVPPKRRLELGREIKLSEKVEPTGHGLLNYLFYAKNQPTTSTERQTFHRMTEAFEHVSAGYRFDVFPDRNNHITLSFARGTDHWVTAGACGLGLQDLLILLYFAIVAPHPVLLIEEPESHLHPDMQRRLLALIRDVTSKQLFVTTHSNVFLNNVFVDRVFFTSFDGSVQVDDATSRASVLDDLGYAVTDNLVSDLVILVEGPSDVQVVEEFLRKYDLLAHHEIKIWPLGGDVMDQLDLSVFAEKYRILALIDRDPDSDAIRRRFERKCKENGIYVHRLSRYSIENYFTLSALRNVFGAQVPAAIDTLKPDTKLAKQIGFDVKKRNRAIAREMTTNDIEGTDLAKFFGRVRSMLSV